MENKGVMIAILLVLSPILFTMAIYPDSFSLSWNQGRGGFLFAAAFIAAEFSTQALDNFNFILINSISASSCV